MQPCRRWCWRIVVPLAVAVCPSTCFGQSILQKLPPDGTQVRYEGTYRATRPRPGAPDQNDTVEWLQRITVSSVGSEEVEGRACRWIEIKVEQGRQGAAGFDVGRAGITLYKFLAPEDAVGLRERDFVPIVRGWRKQYGDLREQVNPQSRPLSGGALRLWPTIALVDHWPDAKEGGTEKVELGGLGSVECRVVAGTRQLQGRKARSTSQGQVWLSDEAPFGVVKWQAASRFETIPPGPNAQYTFEGELASEMTLVEIGDGARSELPEQR